MRGNSVHVIIPVFGNRIVWEPLAKVAFRSVWNQSVRTNVRIRASYSDNIMDARNNEALYSDCEYLIFLDADDTLHPTYIEEMLKGTADIRVPSVHRHYENGHIDTDQVWYQPKDLMTGNYIVVSAMIRTSLFKQLGGFHDYDTLEDWDLWLRAEEAVATFEQIPEATLHVNKRIGSRNSNKSFDEILYKAKERRGLL